MYNLKERGLPLQGLSQEKGVTLRKNILKAAPHVNQK